MAEESVENAALKNRKLPKCARMSCEDKGDKSEMET